MLVRFMALVTSLVYMARAQDQRSNILNQGSNENSQSVIVTPRTRAFLSCESGDMVVKVNFTQPFRGLMYAHRSRSSPCRVRGAGGHYSELRIPLKGCGTWQESPRVFVNNITIRFHPALELEEDETKTVVCRYPPPHTPAPADVQVMPPPINVLPTVTPNRVGKAKLSEVEILIIICLLLFLSLLILGIGIAYFCLKRRNIHIIRKTKTSSAPPSQITRLSSLHSPSSVLSSILGHSVRIPRAVPYSAPRLSPLSASDHHYEDYNNSISASETASVSETSASSTSVSEDPASRRLLYRKEFPKTLLSIPKAILRRSRPMMSPAASNYSEFAPKASAAPLQTTEMEDQIVTTVLEPENIYAGQSQSKLEDTSKASIKTTPVYAQVHKPKKSSTEKCSELVDAPKRLPSLSKNPAGATIPRQIVVTPEEKTETEEVTKNTTVFTSVRRDVVETTVSPSSLEERLSKSGEDARTGATRNPSLNVNKSETSTLISNVPKTSLETAPKNLIIRDVADIYLTTTVETESREKITTVSREMVQEYAKKNNASLEEHSLQETRREAMPPSSNITDRWNVIIRQKEPLLPKTSETTDSEISSQSNEESSSDLQPERKPQFDVSFRTIPPEQVQPNTSVNMISIPPMEELQSVSKLKQTILPGRHVPAEEEDVERSPPRTVRWGEDVKTSENATVSSSDSFQSAASLRERSSSEVLEVAPTLPNQQRKHTNAPEAGVEPSAHQVRWAGGVVPVLESLSPDFLATIPVVIQGGFFHQNKESKQ